MMTKKRSMTESSAPAAESDNANLVSSTVEIIEGGTYRDEVPCREALQQGQSFKIMSYNVNGLRAVYRQHLDKLQSLISDEDPDLILLQETKLQTSHVADFEDFLPAYEQHWTCSTTKKGYSGCCALVRKVKGLNSKGSKIAQKKKKTQASIASFFGRPNNAAEKKKEQGDEGGNRQPTGASPELPRGLAPLAVTMGVPEAGCDDEGRSITLEYDAFYVIGLYVPNSGASLDRLSYRTDQWDPALREYVSRLEQSKPVIVTGDLNVAHLDLDIYNAGAKHLARQAGCTPEERASFGLLLGAEEGGEGEGEGAAARPPRRRRDAFRALHPGARGQYTWWSTRSNGRPQNKGLRLDYFIVSEPLFGGHFLPCDADENSSSPRNDNTKKQKRTSAERPICPEVYEVRHVYSQSTVGVSDHCPIVLTLKLC